MTPFMQWIYNDIIKYRSLQDNGILLVESNENMGVFREHVNSVGGQVSTVPSLNVSVAPS